MKLTPCTKPEKAEKAEKADEPLLILSTERTAQRCVNCGGYADPDAVFGEGQHGCTCKGKYAPWWNTGE